MIFLPQAINSVILLQFILSISTRFIRHSFFNYEKHKFFASVLSLQYLFNPHTTCTVHLLLVKSQNRLLNLMCKTIFFYSFVSTHYQTDVSPHECFLSICNVASSFLSNHVALLLRF